MLELLPLVTLLVSFILLFRVPAVQKSPRLSLVFTVAIAVSAWLAFSEQLGILAVLVAVGMTLPLFWKVALDSVWKDFIQTREAGPARARQLPARDALLALPQVLVSSTASGLLFAAFAALALSHGTGSRSLSFGLAMLVFGVLQLALGPVMLKRMRKSRWYPVQVRLVRAAVSLGDRRSRKIAEAIEAECSIGMPGGAPALSVDEVAENR